MSSALPPDPFIQSVLLADLVAQPDTPGWTTQGMQAEAETDGRAQYWRSVLGHEATVYFNLQQPKTIRLAFEYFEITPSQSLHLEVDGKSYDAKTFSKVPKVVNGEVLKTFSPGPHSVSFRFSHVRPPTASDHRSIAVGLSVLEAQEIIAPQGWWGRSTPALLSSLVLALTLMVLCGALLGLVPRGGKVKFS